MASSDKKLEQQLMEAGNRLLDPPSSVDELLRLLDQVENCLSSVEQAPSKPMKNAMSPSLKALVADKLYDHSDADVRVSVASCLSEITRITAPDAPYDDGKMRKVFQSIVSSFENLDDKSTRSYAKRTLILETAAKVQSCVVMLDLECDALIIEMFQYFLKAIRDYHPENVFSSMESIMTLVLEESEDISPELLSPLLDSVRKDNEEALPIAQKLAQKVLQNCAPKVRPFLIEAVKSLGISLDDYGDVVASICQEISGAVKQNQVATNENVVDRVIPTVAAQEQADVPKHISPKSVISNCDTQTGKDDSLADSGFTKKQEDGDHIVQCKNIDGSSNAEPDSLVSEQIKPSNTFPVDGDKEGETLLDKEDDVEDLPASSHKNPSTELVACSENGKETNREKKKKNERLIKETKQSVYNVSEQASEGASDPEAKTITIVDTAKSVSNNTSDSKEKPPKQSVKKVGANNDDAEESLKRILDKKLGRGKDTSGKDTSKTSANDDKKKRVASPKSASKFSKNEHGSEEMPETRSKRKRSPAKKASDVKEYGENLIGLRIKVWWPIDRSFYEAIVDSYDSTKKKHLVLYDDGDQEILNLNRERWEFTESDSEKDEEEAADHKSPNASSEMPEKKKAKTDIDQSEKQGTMDASTISGGTASSKSKAAATKSGKKPKDDEKDESRPKENSEASSKPETDSLDKGKDKRGEIGGRIVAVASKLTGKARNDVALKKDSSGSAKSNAKSKQETPNNPKSKQGILKTLPNTKGKSPSPGKSNLTASVKTKPGSSKAKKNTVEEESTDVARKSLLTSKGKSPGSINPKGSEGKSAKKRKR